jgi:hypothetical protein
MQQISLKRTRLATTGIGSEGYKVAMDICRKNSDTVRDPSKQSLYEFVRRYSNNWKLHGEDQVPHVIPSFRSVPKRGGQNKERYLMFLRALLLMHKPGSTFNQVSVLDQPQLEDEALDFSMSSDCPEVVAEEYDQSQLDEEDDEEAFDGIDDNVQPLLVEPELEQGPHIQENWQELLGPMAHHNEPHVEDGEADYDNQDMNNEDYDWQEDSRLLGLSEQDKLELPGWINMTKIFEDVEEDNAVVGGLPKNLNPKQLLAYEIICNHIKGVKIQSERYHEHSSAVAQYLWCCWHREEFLAEHCPTVYQEQASAAQNLHQVCSPFWHSCFSHWW